MALTKQIALRMNAALLHRIAEHATSVGRHRSEIIDLACIEYLDRHPTIAKPPPTEQGATHAVRKLPQKP